ncbi:hypothetical protein [Phenylobacterium sp.]|uniref:hypothetical protein n=1 Tax=Phenylobacterium sp. TaxID=1871053 RepID=UPI0035B4D746
MGHIGQEVGLVAARLFQLAGLQFDRGVETGQFISLGFQNLGLLFQLGVGLLQFDLLLFEPDLRLLEGPALLLEFLVGDP